MKTNKRERLAPKVHQAGCPGFRKRTEAPLFCWLNGFGRMEKEKIEDEAG